MKSCWTRKSNVVVAGALLLSLFGGCFGGSDGDCDYWVEQLKRGKREKDSVVKIGELRCEAAVGDLKARFDDTLYRREILTAISAIFNPNDDRPEPTSDALSIVQQALRDKEVGPLAIQLAIDWRPEDRSMDGQACSESSPCGSPYFTCREAVCRETLTLRLASLVRRQRNASIRLQALQAFADLLSPPSNTIGSGDNSTLHFEGKAGRSSNVLIHLLAQDSELHKELAQGVTVLDDTLIVKGDFSKTSAADVVRLIERHDDASHLVSVSFSGDGTGMVSALEEPVSLSRTLADKGLIETLSWVVGQEPTLQGVDCNQYAADRLREVNWSDVDDATATEAAHNLVKALFMKDAQNNSAQLKARLALRTIGPQAVDPILTAYQGNNTQLNQFAQERGMASWRYTQGHELVEMLWDVGDNRASPALMKSIGISLNPPPADVARMADQTEWQTANANRLSTIALTVGALPNDLAVRHAKELLQKTNPAPEINQFVKAGLGLALMGSAKAREALWELFNQGGDIAEKRTQLAELRARAERGNDTELKAQHDALYDEITRMEATKANYITNLVIGLGPDEVDNFKTQVMDLESGGIKQNADMPLPRAYFNTVLECRNQLSCYVGRLEALAPKACTQQESEETCTCEAGFVLQADQRTCSALAGIPAAARAAQEAITAETAAVREELGKPPVPNEAVDTDNDGTPDSEDDDDDNDGTPDSEDDDDDNDKIKDTTETELAEKEAGKSVNERITVVREFMDETYKSALEIKAVIDEIDGLSGAEKEARNDERNTKVREFNGHLDKIDELRERLNQVYAEKNAIVARLDPFKLARDKELEKLHSLEKVMLMLGTTGTFRNDPAAHVQLIANIFHEASGVDQAVRPEHRMYTQFLQWGLITLEHLATPENVAILESLLEKEKGEEGTADTLWTLRLQSLIERVQRRAAPAAAPAPAESEGASGDESAPEAGGDEGSSDEESAPADSE